jgi:hypothetical protein
MIGIKVGRTGLRCIERLAALTGEWQKHALLIDQLDKMLLETEREIHMTRPSRMYVEQEANRSGNWQKFAPTIAHLQKRMRRQRDHINNR